MIMKKTIAALMSIVMLATLLAGCGQKKDKNRIVIWTSGEDYKNEYYLTECQTKFPDYDIVLEYMNSSTIAAKVQEEGENCSCDIIISEEYGYLELCEDYLAELTDFDFSPYLDEIVPDSHKYTPELKNGGCIVINKNMLADKGLPVPSSYEDLLNPCYEGLISMPNPLSSGTGYMFLRQLTNEWGEDAAFAYFEGLSKNVLQYTSSGSGPINALVQGEVAIGFGMISQAVVEKNAGVDIDITFFAEGAPYSMYGNAVLSNSASRSEVMEVFNYLATDLCKGNNEKFFPDQIYKDFVPEVSGYPANVKYGNMSNDTLSEKERLQARWTFS